MQGLRVVTSFRPTLKAKAEKGKENEKRKSEEVFGTKLMSRDIWNS